MSKNTLLKDLPKRNEPDPKHSRLRELSLSELRAPACGGPSPSPPRCPPPRAMLGRTRRTVELWRVGPAGGRLPCTVRMWVLVESESEGEGAAESG